MADDKENKTNGWGSGVEKLSEQEIKDFFSPEFKDKKTEVKAQDKSGSHGQTSTLSEVDRELKEFSESMPPSEKISTLKTEDAKAIEITKKMLQEYGSEITEAKLKEWEGEVAKDNAQSKTSSPQDGKKVSDVLNKATQDLQAELEENRIYGPQDVTFVKVKKKLSETPTNELPDASDRLREFAKQNPTTPEAKQEKIASAGYGFLPEDKTQKQPFTPVDIDKQARMEAALKEWDQFSKQKQSQPAKSQTEQEAELKVKYEKEMEKVKPRAQSAPPTLEANNESAIKTGGKKKRSKKSQRKAARKEAVKAEIKVRERSKSDPTPTTTKLKTTPSSIRSESSEPTRSNKIGGISSGLKGILNRVSKGLDRSGKSHATQYLENKRSKQTDKSKGGRS